MMFRLSTGFPGAALLTALLVSGCALPPPLEEETGPTTKAVDASQPERAASGAAAASARPVTEEEVNRRRALNINCSTTVSPEQRVELDAIDAMMAKSQNYAALARLETLEFQTQYHWLRWAQLLGKVDQLKLSENAYQQIVEACGSAEAYHGLGVVYAKRGDVDKALEALQSAKSKAPARAEIRNDLGIVLMTKGLYGQAAFELRTAYELAQSKVGVDRNMVAAYYLRGGPAMVTNLQQELGLSDAVVTAGIEFSKRFDHRS